MHLVGGFSGARGRGKPQACIPSQVFFFWKCRDGAVAERRTCVGPTNELVPHAGHMETCVCRERELARRLSTTEWTCCPGR